MEPWRGKCGRWHYWRNWAAFFILGTLNNLAYVLVNSSGRVLANSFNTLNLLPMILFSNVAFGFVAKGGNTLLTLTRFPFWIRFFINGCLMGAGLIGVAFAPNFWVALAAIVVVGFSSSFGENLTLGYLSYFRKEMVNAWSSGTGLAGVLGAILYLLLSCVAMHLVVSRAGSFSPANPSYLNELKEINRFVFLGALPVVFVYWFSYFALLRRPGTQTASMPVQKEQQAGLGRKGVGVRVREGEGEREGEDGETRPLLRTVNEDSVPMKSEGRLARVARCFRLTLWLSVNLVAVYMFEYVCQGFAAKSRPKEEFVESELNCSELYASLQLTYQAGVFVSRSSVGVLPIRRVEVFTVLQLINMLLWMLQAWWKFLPVYVLPSLMVYVGLLGGASYANTFYMIRSDKKYPERDRELCTNITSMWITFGILSGALFQLSFFETIYQDK